MAKTKQEIDAMDARERLWESLGTSYGKKLDQSNASYDAAISKQDRTMLGRGMQRSSYNQQILGNLQNQKIKAANDIESEKIADYQNRLYQIERDEKTDEQWEREFGEKTRQFDTNLAETKRQYDESLAENKRQYDTTMEYNKSRDTVSDEHWEKEFGYTEEQADKTLAYNYVTSIIAAGGTPSDDLLARAGLSRTDANAMTAQVATGGGGGGYTKPKTTNDQTTGGVDGWADDLFATNVRNIITGAANVVASTVNPYTPYGEWKTNQEKKKNG